MPETPSAERNTTAPVFLAGGPGRARGGFRRPALVVSLALIAE